MKRLVLLNAAILLVGLFCALGGWLTMDKEAWLVACLCGVLNVVAGAVLLITALVERRLGLALSGLGFGLVGFLAAYFELLVGAATASATGRPLRVRGRRVATGELASVPAFARLAFQLWAHRAPPELIERAHRAALDEIRHARLRGEPFVPLPIDAGLDAGTIESIALESLLDGVIAEGRAAARETDARIASDERAHAQLARDVIAWCHAARCRSSRSSTSS